MALKTGAGETLNRPFSYVFGFFFFVFLVTAFRTFSKNLPVSSAYNFLAVSIKRFDCSTVSHGIRFTRLTIGQ